ncbi:hypothetical protein BT69DRAFT_1312482 [Atractiella rhizophila]|nr:hypothetical protein BT69DRAFT_1312482 [Atractiella rhizophila]
MAAQSIIPVLVTGMLVTGVSNSLWTKYQDMQCVENCQDEDVSKHKEYSQPVWQTLVMFIGETFCLIVFLLLSQLRKWRSSSPTKQGYQPVSTSVPHDSAVAIQDDDEDVLTSRAHVKRDNASHVPHGEIGAAPLPLPVGLDDPEIILEGHAVADQEDAKTKEVKGLFLSLLFWFPAACDILATTLMNTGLLFVPVSVYQMTRGALVLFVGTFSVIFLKRKLGVDKWVSLVIVVLGVAVVGYANAVGSGKKGEDVGSNIDEGVGLAILGVSMIAFAQIFTATQFVVEEKIMERYSIEPLRAVGYEGIYGLTTTSISIAILHVVIGRTDKGRGGYFDATAGFHQIMDNPTVWGSSIAIAISIAFFNFFGLGVTRSVSATARSTIDTCRTLGIWVVSLGLGWETFRWLQVVGFALLVYGTFAFNGIVTLPHWLGGPKPNVPAIVISDSEEERERRRE